MFKSKTEKLIEKKNCGNPQLKVIFIINELFLLWFIFCHVYRYFDVHNKKDLKYFSLGHCILSNSNLRSINLNYSWSSNQKFLQLPNRWKKKSFQLKNWKAFKFNWYFWFISGKIDQTYLKSKTTYEVVDNFIEATYLLMTTQFILLSRFLLSSYLMAAFSFFVAF